MQTELNAPVEEVFLAYPPAIRAKLYALRKLILKTAARTDGVGPLTETLKWGEPAYLTEQPRTGSTIRIGWKASRPTHYAMYFNCQTTLVDTCRTLFPELAFEGNRAVLFDAARKLPVDAASRCIELALTYHLAKRHRNTTRRAASTSR